MNIYLNSVRKYILSIILTFWLDPVTKMSVNGAEGQFHATDKSENRRGYLRLRSTKLQLVISIEPFFCLVF